MKVRCLTSGLAAAGLAATSALAAASMAFVGPSMAQSAPTAAPRTTSSSTGADSSVMKGRQVFQDVCGSCHDPAVTTGQMKSHEDWEATVSRMATEGAPLSDEQIAQVVDYLSKAYGIK